MKTKLKELVKDCGVGVGIGCAVIVPGISAGTIAVITNTFKKIVNAVDGLFSKDFFKNLLILLPFGLVGVLTVALLIKPLNAAMDACLFAIIALFAGFIGGSLPGVVDEIRGEKPTKINVCLLIAGFLITVIIGVSSLIFNFSNQISILFETPTFWTFIILILVGVIGSMGLIVPGLSGSAILLIFGFYQPILNIGKRVVSFENDFWSQLAMLATFALGVLIGFILFSKLINQLITNHKTNSYFTIIGLIVGSLISLFVNSNVFSYVKNGSFNTLDIVLSPILLIIGFLVAYLLVRLNRKTNNKIGA